MNISLEVEDAELLHRLLERALGNLRMEIAGTEKLEWRQSLHEDEARLKSILARLPEKSPTAG